MNTKKRYYIASAVMGALSAFLITDYCFQKKRSRAVKSGSLIAGILGLAVSAAFAYEPVRQVKQEQAAKEVLDDHDVQLIHQNISEVLTGIEEE